jgi:hypothetical protein
LSKFELLGRLRGFCFIRGGRVNPDRGGRALGLWVAAFEAGWFGREGGGEGLSTNLQDRFGAPVVEISRGQGEDSRVAMVLVVPVEEGPAVAASIFQAAEARGEVGSVLRSLNYASLNELSSLV